MSDSFMRVTYKGANGYCLVADVYQEDLATIERSRKDESEEVRRRVYRSVVKSLEKATKLMRQGYVPNADEMQNLANDVGIWLSFEIAAGRMTFTPTVEA